MRMSQWIAGVACCVALGACGDDDGAAGTAGTAGTSGAGGSAGTAGAAGTSGAGGSAGSSGNGGSGGSAGAAGTGGDPGVTQWIVGAWLTDPDGEYTGLLSVVDDLSDQGIVNIANASEWPTDFTYVSAGGGVVFVGRDDAPELERWQLNDEGALEQTGTLGLMAYGVTSTLGRSLPVIQVISETRAYYVDIENFQVIVFNPTATPMIVYPDDTFAIDGLDVEGEWEDVGSVTRDGDRLIVTGRYWDETDDTATPLVRAAIVDVTDDSVQYAQDTRCSNVASTVTDETGNIYFGSHPGLSVSTAAGLNDDDSPPACIVRMKPGEDVFDPAYLVDLEAISGGVVGGLEQGVDNHAYVAQYAGAGITAENTRAEMFAANWEIHLIELGDEANTYAKVEGIPNVPAYNSSFTTTVGHEQKTFLVCTDSNFEGGRYYDVSVPDTPVPALEFPGYPGHAIAID